MGPRSADRGIDFSLAGMVLSFDGFNGAAIS